MILKIGFVNKIKLPYLMCLDANKDYCMVPHRKLLHSETFNY